jgi:prepilin-type processing-associated H-X9-DG protein
MHEPAMLLPGATVPTTIDIDFADAGAVVGAMNALFKADVAAALFEFYLGLTPDEKQQDLGPLPRLRNGIERFFISDINNAAASAAAASEIPVMWDETAGYNAVDVFNHVPGGCNVLYMDGHVEFLKWQSEFPANVTQMYVYLMQG